MNSSLPRKQLSTPVKTIASVGQASSTPQHTYSLRSDSKAKLPVLSSTATSIQAQSSPFGQPIEILPSKPSLTIHSSRQALLGQRQQATSKLCLLFLLLHRQRPDLHALQPGFRTPQPGHGPQVHPRARPPAPGKNSANNPRSRTTNTRTTASSTTAATSRTSSRTPPSSWARS